MKIKLLASILLAIFALPSFAQMSQKEATEKKVKSVSEWETDLRDRKPKAILETYVKYDERGNILEIQERDGDGLIKLHEKYTYDLAGNKITEEQFDSDGELKKKHVYTFDNGLRVARKSYNKNGDLIGDKKYVYEFYK